MATRKTIRTTYKFLPGPTPKSNSNASFKSGPDPKCNANIKPRVSSFSAEIPRILSRVETLQIVFERAPNTFRLFDIALYRLEETMHQLSTMLLALDENQRQRMDVHAWLEETGRLLQSIRKVVNESFEKNGRITRVWQRMLRAKVEGSWWENHRVVDLSMAVLEHCVELSRRYERLVYDLLRAQEEAS